MSLLPSSPDLSSEREPRVVSLDSEEADDLMAALSSETARRVLSELHEEPAPPGEIADRVDTSLQNAQYHIGKLEEAGAIDVVGTAYSEKGREMSVYGPADSPLVIFAGEKDRASGLRSAVSRLFGGFLALAAAAVAVQAAFGGTTDETPAESDSEDGGDMVEAADSPEPTPQTEVEEAAPEAADGIGAIFDWLFGSGLPPGVAFFFGGAIVLTIVISIPYVRAQLRARR